MNDQSCENTPQVCTTERGTHNWRNTRIIPTKDKAATNDLCDKDFNLIPEIRDKII